MFAETYKIVLEAASFDDLKNKLAGSYIDERKEGNPLITVAAQLAIDGKDKQVDWLRQFGANVDDIAYGYALAGDDTQVDIYHNVHKAKATFIARGYAQAKKHERAKAYCINRACPGFIANGYVLAKEHALVETYRLEHKANVDEIAYGYALIEDHDRVEVYCKTHKADVYAIVAGYAQAKNYKQVEAYRIEYQLDATPIAYSHLVAGNYEQVELYRIHHRARVDTIASGYARIGNHEQVKLYYQNHKATAYAIAKGYAAAKNHKKQKEYERYHINALLDSFNDLLDSYLTQRTSIKDSSGKIKQYFYGDFFSSFQKSFTQKEKAVNALRSALNGENVDLSEHLSTLRNGKLGQDLRRFIKSGKANFLVDEKVNTVSDFVQALQDKVKTHQENPPI